jgi:hypothetical protein
MKKVMKNSENLAEMLKMMRQGSTYGLTETFWCGSVYFRDLG